MQSLTLLNDEQTETIVKAQATFAITEQFRQQYSNPQLLETYIKAYKVHKKEMLKFKALITQLSGSIVPDLDQPDVELTYDVTEEMKKLLLQAKDKI